MRDEIKKQLVKYGPKFWQIMENLPPKDFIDVYLKILPYGFAKAPEERPIGEEEQAKLVLEEVSRKATIIGRGLQAPAEEAEAEEK